MEYILFAFTGINILPSVLLILIIFYWLLIILGIFSFEIIDFDIDFGLDFNIDIGLDFESGMFFDGGIELEENNSRPSKCKLFFYRLLKFLNIGTVPIMIYLSILILVWWILSMLVYYINISPDSMMGD